MNKSIWVSAFAVLAVGSQAKADSFQMQVARVQGDITCQVSTANGGTLDCASDIKAVGQQSLTLSTMDQVPGFVGMDTVTDAFGESILVVGADTSKNVQSVSIVHGQKNADGSDQIDLTAVDTKALSALSITPLTIQALDNQTAKISLSFVSYGTSCADTRAVGQSVIQKIMPTLMSLRARLIK